MQLFDSKWDDDRHGIFEPIPFKGDENKLYDDKDRPELDEEEGDKGLFVAPDAAANEKANAKKIR